MPIAFPPADRGPAYAPNSGVEQFTSGFDISNLGIVGAEFTRDSLAPGMALDYNTSRAVNLRNMDYQYEAIDFGNQPNPVPAPLMNDGNFVLQFDWAASNSEIVGVTRTSTGTVLANCAIDLFETGSDLVRGRTVSGADGSFNFGNPGTGPFYLVAYKTGSPDVAGTTVNTVMPTPYVYTPPTPPSAPTLPQAANKVFHLSADSLALGNGATVTTGVWADSVNGVTNTTVGTPTFQTNAYGIKPSVRFDGSTSYMTLGRPTALTAALDAKYCTVVVVAKVLSMASIGMMFGASAGGDSWLMQGCVGSTRTYGRYDSNQIYDAPSTDSTSLFVTAHTIDNTYTMGSSNTLQRSYLQGGCVASVIAPAASVPDTGGNNFSIGATSAGALKCNADIFEILVWNTVLTPMEMKQVQAWVCDKYGQATPWSTATSVYVFDGDSITAGVGGSGCVNTYPYKSAQSLSLAYGQWDNLGVGGMVSNNMVTKMTAEGWLGLPAYTGKPLRVAAFEYYNVRGGPAVTIQGYMNTYCTAVRANGNTKLVLGTATSHSADTTGTPDTVKSAYCAYYDTNNASYSDAYVPIHTSCTNIGPVNSTAAHPTYFSDGVHLTALGYTELAGAFTTALTGL